MAEPAQPGVINPNIEVDFATEPPPVHCNYVYVHVLPAEAALLVCDVAPFPNRITNEGRTLLARVVASLRMPIVFFFNCVFLLASQWNKYAVGQMQETPGTKLPRFTVIDPPPGMVLEGLEDIAP